MTLSFLKRFADEVNMPWVKLLRFVMGLSQEGFGRLNGMSKDRVSGIELGRPLRIEEEKKIELRYAGIFEKGD